MYYINFLGVQTGVLLIKKGVGDNHPHPPKERLLLSVATVLQR